MDALTSALWIVAIVLQVLLVGIVAYRRRYRVFPAFTFYIVANICQSGVVFWVYYVWGYNSRLAWLVAWSTHGLVLLARILAIVELARHLLGHFRGIWRIARWLIAAAGLLAFAYAITTAKHDVLLALTSAELSLEVAAAAFIVALVLFASYYGVEVTNNLKAMLAGFCIFSCLTAVNDSVLERWLSRYSTVWNQLGTVAFLVAVMLWIRAMWQRLPQQAIAPPLDASTYRELSSGTNDRLRKLNDLLRRLWKTQESSL